MSDPSQLSPASRAAPVAFTRPELNKILHVYGIFVSAGEWRDYAIDCAPGAAVFSIFKRASEAPLYRVEKRPHLARRQGAYAILNAAGVVLKRGRDLVTVLRVFDRKRLRLVK